MHLEQQHDEFDLLLESQYWSAERLRDLQRSRLEPLLRHAREHVPFYSTRLDPLFGSDGTIRWDRWEDVPVLRREDLIKHRKALLARMMPEGHGQIGDVSTSGSTGTPVTTSHTTLSLALSQAAVFRANVNDNIDFGARLGLWTGERADIAAWPEGRRAGRWGPGWDVRAREGRKFEISHTAPAKRALEYMARHQVQYVMMGGTDARLFAYEAQRLGLSLPLEVIFTRGTDPTAAGKQLVADVFGARTIALYSSKEAHRIAHPCATCGKWHVNDEQVLVEIVDDTDQSVAGRSGRVVVTPFNSYAEPLIRYDQGDYAARGSSQTCGRGLSVLAEIVGRVRHMFVMPDGSRIVPTLTVPAVLALNASMFQVAQVSPDLVEVRYVPLQNEQTTDTAPAQAELAGQLHAGIRIVFRNIERFQVPLGRKHIEFVSELGPTEH
jgi:phenylacetate-CoA ligase